MPFSSERLAEGNGANFDPVPVDTLCVLVQEQSSCRPGYVLAVSAEITRVQSPRARSG